MGYAASVVVPAHNEARTVGRLLDALLGDAGPGEFEIVVVCNGCTDDTAAVARARGAAVRVAELEEPSKHRALVEGDRLAATFPRLYVDADVELDTAGARELVGALRTPGTLAAAPERELVLEHSSRLVRSYYRVWAQLPVVRTGLFGRGVLGVSAAGHCRIDNRPDVLGDDLYLHSRFDTCERRIVETARSRVRGPRSTADLVRRRTRAAEGNAQLAGLQAALDSTAGTARDLVSLLRRPGLWLDVPVFVAITLLGRGNGLRRRRGGQPTEWLRDESSRV